MKYEWESDKGWTNRNDSDQRDNSDRRSSGLLVFGIIILLIVGAGISAGVKAQDVSHSDLSNGFISDNVQPNSGYCSEDFLAKYFEQSKLKVAKCICKHESGGDPNAINSNGEYSVGLFQINLNAGHPGKGSLAANRLGAGCSGVSFKDCVKYFRNPDNNVEYTSWLREQNGWGPWTTFNAYCRK